LVIAVGESHNTQEEKNERRRRRRKERGKKKCVECFSFQGHRSHPSV
jgi:hypothetical protein